MQTIVALWHLALCGSFGSGRPLHQGLFVDDVRTRNVYGSTPKTWTDSGWVRNGTPSSNPNAGSLGRRQRVPYTSVLLRATPAR